MLRPHRKIRLERTFHQEVFRCRDVPRIVICCASQDEAQPEAMAARLSDSFPGCRYVAVVPKGGESRPAAFAAAGVHGFVALNACTSAQRLVRVLEDVADGCAVTLVAMEDVKAAERRLGAAEPVHYTACESQVQRLCEAGHKPKDIARLLYKKVSTIRHQIDSIHKKQREAARARQSESLHLRPPEKLLAANFGSKMG